jgi:Domain of unknown function (DUF4349)
MTTADLTEQLRAARPVAPETLRERVRAIAAGGVAEPAPRRLPVLRLPPLRLAVPVVAATAVAAAALVAVVRPEHRHPTVEATRPEAATTLQGAADKARVARSLAPVVVHGNAAGTALAPAAGRAQHYEAQIALEVEDDDALSRATKQAMTIARNLGGFVDAAQYATGGTGTATLTLRVPTDRVQDAIAQLTALGRITSQQVQLQDLQTQLDALDRQIDTLARRIAHITALLAAPDLTAERRAQLEEQRAQLQTALRRVHRERSGTAQQAALATIQLSLATKLQSGIPAPASRWRRSLDEAGRILAWEGIAMLYALAVIVPFGVLGGLAWFGARARRRSEERRLLTRTP